MQTRSSMRYRARRVPCRTEVSVLRSHGPAVPAEIRDISLLGARLAGVAGLSRRDPVRVEILGRWREGQICWSRGPLSGLLFEAPLSGRDLASLAGEASGGLGLRRQPLGRLGTGPGAVPRAFAPISPAGRASKPDDAEAAIARLLLGAGAGRGETGPDWEPEDLRRTG